MSDTVKKSRTQLKKEVQALQKMGERLVGLPPDQLRQIPMEPELEEAVHFAGKLKKHEARRRQLQYIGSLMRQLDTEPIRAALEQLDQGHRTDIRVFRQTEAWRDRLVAGDDALLRTIRDRCPDADQRHIQRLTDEARQEKASGNKPKASRALFRYLKPLAHQVVHSD